MLLDIVLVPYAAPVQVVATIEAQTNGEAIQKFRAMGNSFLPRREGEFRPWYPFHVVRVSK
jgi:hypothetical protein